MALGAPSQGLLAELLSQYGWPSQAFWRYFEMVALQAVELRAPVLELGCGDGAFTAKLLSSVEEAVDINPKSVERCRVKHGGVYRSVTCRDARDLVDWEGRFSTVFANCVIEHIPDLERLLAGCHQVLKPGGRMVATVPLEEMNRHLALPWGWYVNLRRRQLEHVNLLSSEAWIAEFRKAGFARVETSPYLSAEACRFWDILDAPGCFPWGRYSFANAIRLTARWFLPPRLGGWMTRRSARWLAARTVPAGGSASPCAAMIVAERD